MNEKVLFLSIYFKILGFIIFDNCRNLGLQVKFSLKNTFEGLILGNFLKQIENVSFVKFDYIISILQL